MKTKTHQEIVITMMVAPAIILFLYGGCIPFLLWAALVVVLSVIGCNAWDWSIPGALGSVLVASVIISSFAFAGHTPLQLQAADLHYMCGWALLTFLGSLYVTEHC